MGQGAGAGTCGCFSFLAPAAEHGPGAIQEQPLPSTSSSTSAPHVALPYHWGSEGAASMWRPEAPRPPPKGNKVQDNTSIDNSEAKHVASASSAPEASRVPACQQPQSSACESLSSVAHEGPAAYNGTAAAAAIATATATALPTSQAPAARAAGTAEKDASITVTAAVSSNGADALAPAAMATAAAAPSQPTAPVVPTVPAPAGSAALSRTQLRTFGQPAVATASAAPMGGKGLAVASSSREAGPQQGTETTEDRRSLLQERASAASTRASTERNLPEEEDDPDAEIDLSRLCASLRSLERSTPQLAEQASPADVLPGLKGSEGVAALPCTTDAAPRAPASAGQSRTSSWQPPASSLVPPVSLKSHNAQQPSEGSSWHPRTPGSTSPATTTSLGSRARDAQRMDAWFQRVLAKGPDKSGVGPSSSAGASTSLPSAAVSSSVASREGGQSLPLTPEPKTLSRSNLPAVQSPPSATAAEGVEEAQQANAASNGALETTPDLVGAARSPGPSNESSLKLEVSLGGSKLGTLSLKFGEDVEQVCREFVATHRLRAVFQAPLEGHVELMVHMAKTEDAVDVCDLL